MIISNRSSIEEKIDLRQEARRVANTLPKLIQKIDIEQSTTAQLKR